MSKETEDELKRFNAMVRKVDVIKEIKNTFEHYADMHNRPQEEQTLLGNFITVVEADLKDRIKFLTEH